MNFTAIIAILELKGVITREEGEKVIEFLNNKPQSTLLNDAVEQVKELVDQDLPAVLASAKTIESKAKAAATKAVEDLKPVADEAKQVADEAKQVAEEAKDKVEEVAKEVEPQTKPETDDTAKK
jgi:membrane protein involved in colicin uptake